MEMSSDAIRQDSIVWLSGFHATCKPEAIVKALRGIEVVARKDSD